MLVENWQRLRMKKTGILLGLSLSSGQCSAAIDTKSIPGAERGRNQGGNIACNIGMRYFCSVESIP